MKEEEFKYDKETDTYRCPAGEILKKRKHRKNRKSYEYAARRRVCHSCELRLQCTKSKTVRTLKRHENHESIEAARLQSHSQAAKRDRIKRKWFMEGSFADAANNHGLKRSRWRRLRNQRIQNFLIASIQNIRILMKHIRNKPRSVMSMAKSVTNEMIHQCIFFFYRLFQKNHGMFYTIFQIKERISFEMNIWATRPITTAPKSILED